MLTRPPDFYKAEHRLKLIETNEDVQDCDSDESVELPKHSYFKGHPRVDSRCSLEGRNLFKTQCLNKAEFYDFNPDLLSPSRKSKLDFSTTVLPAR
jgi:hypothetical protein